MGATENFSFCNMFLLYNIKMKDVIEIDNGDNIIFCKLEQKNIKSFRIIVKSKEDVIVRYPKFVNYEDVLKIIEQKKIWILNSVEKQKIKTKNNLREKKIVYLGFEFKIVLNQKKLDENIVFDFDNLTLYSIFDNSIDVYLEYKKLIKIKALNIFSERIKYYENIFGDRKINKLTIKDLKSKWGSMSSKGEMVLNINLIKLDMKIIDYVIVHELAHISHAHHQKSFWKEVEKIMPDYKKFDKSLKNYSL